MTRSVAPPPLERMNSLHTEGASAASGRVLYLLVAALAVGVLLPLGSSAFGLYDHVTHWGKLVHAVSAACAAFIFGLLLLGWRDRTHVALSDELATLLTLFFGVLFGVLWEIVEFVRDWVAYSDLQKSNTDTMTDFLFNDVATVIAALVAMRLYCHAITAADRERLGAVAEWLVHGPSRLLDRHGFALLTAAVCIIAACVALLWFAGRPVPGLPIP
jgi:hypothetical protein